MVVSGQGDRLADEIVQQVVLEHITDASNSYATLKTL